MRQVYIPKKLPTYLQSQVSQGKMLPSVATAAIGVIESRESKRARIT